MGEMGLIIKNKEHYFKRFIIGIIVIVLFGLLPFIIGSIGATISEISTGEPCHEGNCIWMVIPWIGLVTLPISVILLIIYLIIIILDSIKLNKLNKP